jgi:hypothetical protein
MSIIELFSNKIDSMPLSKTKKSDWFDEAGKEKIPIKKTQIEFPYDIDYRKIKIHESHPEPEYNFNFKKPKTAKSSDVFSGTEQFYPTESKVTLKSITKDPIRGPLDGYSDQRLFIENMQNEAGFENNLSRVQDDYEIAEQEFLRDNLFKQNDRLVGNNVYEIATGTSFKNQNKMRKVRANLNEAAEAKEKISNIKIGSAFHKEPVDEAAIVTHDSIEEQLENLDNAIQRGMFDENELIKINTFLRKFGLEPISRKIKPENVIGVLKQRLNSTKFKNELRKRNLNKVILKPKKKDKVEEVGEVRPVRNERERKREEELRKTLSELESDPHLKSAKAKLGIKPAPKGDSDEEKEVYINKS